MQTHYRVNSDSNLQSPARRNFNSAVAVACVGFLFIIGVVQFAKTTNEAKAAPTALIKTEAHTPASLPEALPIVEERFEPKSEPEEPARKKIKKKAHTSNVSNAPSALHAGGKKCRKGQPCGNSCISWDKVCRK